MKTLADFERERGGWLFPCDCGDMRHGLNVVADYDTVWLEILYFPFTWRERIKAALSILRYGVGGIDAGSMIVRSDDMEALVEMLRLAVTVGKEQMERM